MFTNYQMLWPGMEEFRSEVIGTLQARNVIERIRRVSSFLE